MNMQRGLWRTWLVLTAIFIIYVTANGIEKIGAEFSQQAEVDALLAGSGEGVPVACTEARGKSGEDWHRLAPMIGNNPNFCWYSLPKFRKYYPEFAGVADLDLLQARYYDANVFFWQPHPWRFVAIWSAIAAIPPLVVLGLGWAVAGFFRSDRKVTQQA